MRQKRLSKKRIAADADFLTAYLSELVIAEIENESGALPEKLKSVIELISVVVVAEICDALQEAKLDPEAQLLRTLEARAKRSQQECSITA